MNFMLSVLVLSCTLAACSEKSESNKSQNGAGANSKSQKTELGKFEYTVEAAKKLSGAEISDVAYDAAKHSVGMTLKYKGCKAALHSLVMGEACAESYPRQCGAAIALPADYDESCATAQEEKLSVSLSDSEDEMVLFVTNKAAKGSSVLIDRRGKVKAATTPPQ
ncbi:MAG: hypothetical protein EOP04_24620 [Proteobacteria bacterium]|nr:MAG: hypothetical protein EOP04_24620 [Pseudomonadota bacterium]